MDQHQPRPSEIVIMAAGVVALIGSFLPFYQLSILGHSASTSAWGSGLFPIATLIPVFGLIMAAQVAAARFGKVAFPDRVGGFTMSQVHLVLGGFAALLALCFLVANKGGSSFGIGYWIVLLGSLGLLTGAVMLERERHAQPA